MRKFANLNPGLGFKHIFIALSISVLAGAITFAFVGDNSTKYKNVEVNKVKIVDIQNRKIAPKLDLYSYSGTPLSFDSNEITVLNFWASWCGPCRQETPILVNISNDYPNVQFIGLTNDDTEEAATKFANQFGITYEIANGDDYIQKIRSVQPIYGLPTTLIIDRQGGIAAKVIGGLSDREFRRALATLSAK